MRKMTAFGPPKKSSLRSERYIYCVEHFANFIQGTKDKKRKEGAEEVLGEENGEKKSKRKKFQAGWMDRMGEDPDKPLKESSAGMEIDESELRTYNDGNPKVSL